MTFWRICNARNVAIYLFFSAVTATTIDQDKWRGSAWSDEKNPIEKLNVTINNNATSPHHVSKNNSRRNIRGRRSMLFNSTEDDDRASVPIESNVVGGDLAPRDRYPYLACVFRRTLRPTCGGSLIAPNLVLSAGHCAEVAVFIGLGVYNVDDALDPSNEEIELFEIIKTHVHPLYNDRTLDYDLAIFELKSDSMYPPVRFNKNAIVPTNGDALTIMGWGAESFRDVQAGFYPWVLHSATVTYMDQHLCARRFTSRQLSRTMMCAMGEDGQDTCVGDSGGPLIKEGKSPVEDLLVGVVSWGKRCSHPYYPGVYSRIAMNEVYNWITDILYVNMETRNAKSESSTTLRGEIAEKKETLFHNGSDFND